MAPTTHGTDILANLPVLFVDDEIVVLRAVSRTVENCPWPVEIATSAHEALRMMEEREFSVVVSDYNMPKMDGVTFLAEVLEHWPETERILLTAYADAEALERGINAARISRFLRKPWKREVLVSILENAVNSVRMRREHAILHQRVRNRNQELSYLNRLLQDSVEESSRAIVGYRRRWDVALNAISDALLIVTSDFCIEGANAATAAMVNQTFEEFEGRKCHEILFNRKEQCLGCPVTSATGRISHSQGRTQRTFDVRAYPLPGDRSTHLCIYRDITHELAFQAEAAHVEKMAAIGRLAGGVAHEINNPLHGILSFVQLAQRPDTPAEKLPRYHEVIRECAIRCRDIVQSLRDFSRRATVTERRRVDLNVVCVKAMVLFENIKDRRVERHEYSEPVYCFGNANQLQQVVVNLVQNALDASPENGLVQVTVKVVDGEAVIAVADEGEGLLPKDREKIFEPFYTTKPEGKGTGLGLAISHNIMREHGGSLKVAESHLGRCVFY
ncbi:MAG: ATP-binding protein [Myxococcota bacterium]